MKADLLLAKFGTLLIGRQVMTEPYGEWPGGVATVKEIQPDPNAPEIPFYVEMDGWDGLMGVFDHEDVELMPKEGG